MSTAANPLTAIDLFVRSQETDARALRERIGYILERLVYEAADQQNRFKAVDVDARDMAHLSSSAPMNVSNHAAEAATLIRQLDAMLAAIHDIEDYRKTEAEFARREA